MIEDDYLDDDRMDLDEEEDFDFDCGMDSSGGCSMAGSEECDFECPNRDAMIAELKMKRIFAGGLMRCCLKTLTEYLDSGGIDNDGTVLRCRWCDGEMVADPDGWRWKP